MYHHCRSLEAVSYEMVKGDRKYCPEDSKEGQKETTQSDVL